MPALSEDRDAIRDLLARYCLYFDSGAADKWASIYTDDGTFHLVGADPMVGTEALQAFCGSLPANSVHHMTTNEIIEVDGDAATCDASVAVVAGGAIVMAGHTHDELRRVEGSWRILHRTVTPDGA